MAIALNYLIAFLLLVTILYCWRLNRRIVELHRGKKELLTLLKAFDQSILRAEEGTKILKHTCNNVGKALQDDIDKAKFLIEDLNFMIDRAASATDKLERNIQTSRNMEYQTSNSHQTFPARPSFNDMTAQPQRTAKIMPRDAPNPMPDDATPNKSKRSSIELLLEKLAGRKDPPSSQQAKRIAYKSPTELGAIDVNITSSSGKAESELMKLLKSAQ